jgi:biuret amidohydrolase
MTQDPAALELVSEPGRLHGMLDPGRTALVVVDVQVDFAAPDGAMAAFGADLSTVGPAIDRMAEVIAAARRAGLVLVWLRVVTREDTDSAASRRLYARRGLDPSALAVCRAGTRGCGYHRLAPQPGDLEIQKTLYSGFHGTRLDEELRSRNIGSLVLVGLTTECCVDSTARDAYHRGYDVFLVTDACAAYHAGFHTGPLQALSQSFALLTDTRTLCQALEPQPVV